jgi:hypothetical protein
MIDDELQPLLHAEDKNSGRMIGMHPGEHSSGTFCMRQLDLLNVEDQRKAPLLARPQLRYPLALMWL